jgi:hypothetical protein
MIGPELFRFCDEWRSDARGSAERVGSAPSKVTIGSELFGCYDE